MNTNLQEQLDKLTTSPSVNHCFSVLSDDWVERPNKDFMDIDFHLPALNRTYEGYKSNTVVVLTTRSTMQGRLLEACLGYVEVDLNEDEADYQSHLQWRSDDGEEVVGWMPVPVFHVDENTTLHQDTSKHQGFLFKYVKQVQE